MSDEERGTYAPPTEDHLSYETRRRPATDQAPLTLIISGIILVLVLMAAVIFYNSGLNSHNKAVPEVGDTLGDLKDVKVQEAQLLTEQDLNGSDTSGARFAPDAEEPKDRTTAPGAEVNEAPPTVAPIAGGLPSQTGDAASKTSTAVALAKPDPTPVPGAPSATTPPATSGSSLVQIGAFTSQEMATAEYNKLASSYGLFLSGTGKRIEKVETGNGTFYRTSVTGFASADKARAFCSALKAAGHDCFVK